MSACGDLIGASTATQPTRFHWERVRRFVLGQRWTDEQRAESQQTLEQLAHARKALAEHARRKLGKPRVELFCTTRPMAPTGASNPGRELGLRTKRTPA